MNNETKNKSLSISKFTNYLSELDSDIYLDFLIKKKNRNLINKVIFDRDATKIKDIITIINNNIKLRIDSLQTCITNEEDFYE